jgi:hypothetical protein
MSGSRRFDEPHEVLRPLSRASRDNLKYNTDAGNRHFGGKASEARSCNGGGTRETPSPHR